MGMSQRIHAETGYEIEIAFTIQIVKKNAFAALEDQRGALVGLKQKLTFAFDDFVRVWHRERRLYRRGTYLPNADLRSATKSGTGSGMWTCFFQAEDGIRNYKVTGVQTCALPI